jgi:hypothetical protein
MMSIRKFEMKLNKNIRDFNNFLAHSCLNDHDPVYFAIFDTGRIRCYVENNFQIPPSPLC